MTNPVTIEYIDPHARRTLSDDEVQKRINQADRCEYSQLDCTYMLVYVTNQPEPKTDSVTVDDILRSADPFGPRWREGARYANSAFNSHTFDFRRAAQQQAADFRQRSAQQQQQFNQRAEQQQQHIQREWLGIGIEMARKGYFDPDDVFKF